MTTSLSEAMRLGKGLPEEARLREGYEPLGHFYVDEGGKREIWTPNLNNGGLYCLKQVLPIPQN